MVHDVPDEVAAKYPAAGLCASGPLPGSELCDGPNGRRGPRHLPAHLLRRHRAHAVAAGARDRHLRACRAETYDLTPFAGRLVDGGAHNLSLSMAAVGGEMHRRPTLSSRPIKNATQTSGAFTQDAVAAAPARPTTVRTSRASSTR